MPGPVSESYKGPMEWRSVKEEWRRQLAADGFHYFVLDMDDLFEVMSEEDARAFDSILVKYNTKRKAAGKPGRAYWVARRDWKCGPEIKRLIEAETGVKLKE